MLKAQKALDDESLPDTVDILDFETAFGVYSKLQAVQWQVLWEAGGIADQDEQLWNDVMTVANIVLKLERILKKKSTPNGSAE